jgi:hypothetical protein
MNLYSKVSLWLLFLAAVTGVAFAGAPEKHPYYLLALSDLRDARGHLVKIYPDDRVFDEEQHAVDEIDAAIGEIKRAAIDDGKDIRDHAQVDAHLDRAGRFRRALELLEKAHHDIDREEDNPNTRGLQQRVLHHVDEAHHIVEQVVHPEE